MARLILAACLASSAHAALELTPDNFDKEVLQSGKAAFIKFLAPWCAPARTRTRNHQPPGAPFSLTAAARPPRARR